MNENHDERDTFSNPVGTEHGGGHHEICAERKKQGKKFKILWSVLALILVVLAAISIIRYSKYQKAQDAAIDLAIATTDQFSSYLNDRDVLLSKMYDYYSRDYSDFHNPSLYNTYVRLYGYSAEMAEANKQDQANARAAAQAMKEIRSLFGDGMEALGFDYGCTEYFEYHSFLDYTNDLPVFKLMVYTWSLLAILLFVFQLQYLRSIKKKIILIGDKLVFKNGEKIKKEFSVADIKSVQRKAADGLYICGEGIKCKLKHLQNADEFYTAINERRTTQASEIPFR